MALTPALELRRAQDPASRIDPDRRRHVRFALPLLGRFMRADKQEYPCKLNDVSVGGASLMSPVAVEIGERIVVYFDQLGGLEGPATRLFDGGFAIEFLMTRHKREKLAAELTWLINRHELGGPHLRRPGHERVALPEKATTLKGADGRSTSVTVLDVSISGASIATDARPDIGSEVHLGKLRARIMRHHAEGIGVQFLDIQKPDALRRYFG